MARRSKPCDWCEEEHWDEYHDGNHALHIEYYPFNNTIGITSFGFRLSEGNDEISELLAEIPMNYCPVCGRKLTI